MTAPIRLACLAALTMALGLALAGCASQPVNEMPATAATPAADAKPEAKPDTKPDAKPDTKPAAKPAAAAEEKGDVTPMDRAQANAQCWMKYDKSGGTLEAKAKLVEKCSDDKMKGR